jgi:hypothetical protein
MGWKSKGTEVIEKTLPAVSALALGMAMSAE